MKKRIVSLVTALLLVMSLIPASGIIADAATIPPAKSITYTCTGNQADDIVGIANTQIGYVDNGVYTAYGQWYGTQTEWCAMFVSWCANKAGIPTSIVPKLNSADRSWYQNKGLYKKAAYWGGSYTPKKGDIIFFDWDNENYAKHVGIVTGTSGNYVYTIEGNTSNSVAKRSYTLTNPDILGYGTPKYTCSNTYTIAYSDGDSSTSYAEDALIIPSHSAKSGEKSATTSKKFTRSGYHYDKWYICKLVNGKAYYWCRERSTGNNPKWIAYDKIPSNYYKTSISHGGKITFNVTNTTLYLTPVWEINTYTLRYSDGIAATSYDADSKIIANQIIKSGASTATSSKKFSRDGYTYDSWYIFKLANGKAHYWCRERSTGKNPKWIAYDKIPSNYYKTSIAHGGKIYFTPAHGSTIFLTPVWKYTRKDISKLNFDLFESSIAYTGEAVYPHIEIDGLTEKSDYTVAYKDSEGKAINDPVEPGKYTVIITGKGNYTGTVKCTFEIIEMASDEGEAFEDEIIADEGMEGEDFGGDESFGDEEIVDDSMEAGEPSGDDISDVPVTAPLRKISTPRLKKVSKTKIKIRWTNIQGETGYQIARSNKKGNGYKIIRTVNSSTCESIVVKIKKKKTYFYKVRAYNTIDGKKVYGPWSNPKKYRLK